MPEPKIQPVAIIDNREQCPFTFANLPTEPGALATGDYSIRGLEHLVSVERKSLDDLLGCIGRDRDRFRRELKRMEAYRFKLLIIESDADTLEIGTWRSQIKPAHVLGSLAAWSAQFGLPVWLGGDHAACGRFTERFLFQCARTVARELQAATALVGAA